MLSIGNFSSIVVVSSRRPLFTLFSPELTIKQDKARLGHQGRWGHHRVFSLSYQALSGRWNQIHMCKVQANYFIAFCLQYRNLRRQLAFLWEQIHKVSWGLGRGVSSRSLVAAQRFKANSSLVPSSLPWWVFPNTHTTLVNFFSKCPYLP